MLGRRPSGAGGRSRSVRPAGEALGLIGLASREPHRQQAVVYASQTMVSQLTALSKGSNEAGMTNQANVFWIIHMCKPRSPVPPPDSEPNHHQNASAI
jgi:hypothetical protein